MSGKTRSQRANYIPLLLECEEEELSDAQKEAISIAEKEYQEAVDKINDMMKSHTVVHKGKDVIVLQNGTIDSPTTPITPSQALPPLVATSNLGAAKTGPNLITRASANQAAPRIAPTTYQLLSSVGGRPLMQASANTIKLTSQANAPAGKIAIPAISTVQGIAAIAPGGQVQLASLGQLTKIQAVTTPSGPSTSSVPTVDLTEGEDDRADSREIVFNKLSGKTFPSLVVLARPSLRVKDNSPAVTNKERASMDARVKAVLIYTPTKFTEWLIQQGLVRSEQLCVSHVGNDNKPLKLKLGMYSDASKFPYSGGYVWISECCPQRFVSVFSGSLFEGAPHPPTVLLKLIYHWACQTSVSNVVQWVKVDNFYVKNFFTHLRALCTAAVHTKMGLLGGLNRFVEVGVISLGTTSQDGQQRQVKVEVLGVLDKEAKLVRLRAIEPMQEGDRNLKRRFAKILEPLVHWANANDVGVIVNGKRCSNQNVMEYLRKIVPRMFLRLNNIAANPFKNWNYLEPRPQGFTLRIATAPNGNYMVQPAANDYTMDVSPQSLCEVQYAPGPASSKRPKTQRQPQPVVPDAQASSSNQLQTATAVKRIKLNTTDQTYLDSYYYADMMGNQQCILEDMDANFSVKCVVCPMNFTNNIALMKHIISHVIYESSDPNSKRFLFCPYCLKRMQTTMQLASHRTESHQNSTAVMACCICQCRFPIRQALIKHMHLRHTASEMPYRCGVCQFRSSFHQKVVDHFYEAHTGGCSLQCPICLKIFYACGIRSRGNYVNLTGFYQHLVGHKRQSNRRKCERCVLTFQQSKQVAEHEDCDHKSMRNQARVVPVVSTENNPTIIIPLPKGGAPPPNPASKASASYGSPPNRNFISTPHPIPIHIKAQFNETCIECKQPLVQRYHLTTTLRCLRCRFVTCCLAAMEQHSKTVHTNSKGQQQKLGKDIVLDKPMFCICGFKSNKGNVLASHLAKCGKRSAYPIPGIEAQSASFPPLVNLDDGDEPNQDPNDQWMKAYVKGKDEEKTTSAGANGSGSMLDVLGLVRKASTDDEAAPPSKKGKQDSDEESEVKAAVEVKEQKTDSSSVAVEPMETEAAAAADTSVEEITTDDIEIKEEEEKSTAKD
ncbi:hypothetical protein B566_EDAN011040 [Ephemera danica]|nr:hypothetical protein B566_EDAN011040 [Ephemera danica]